MTYQSQLTELKGMIEKIEYYKYTTDALIYWDKITYMPRNAIEYRSKVMSFLAGEQYRLLSDSRFQKLIRFFNGNAKNDFVTNAMIRRLIRNSESIRSCTGSRVSEVCAADCCFGTGMGRGKRKE